MRHRQNAASQRHETIPGVGLIAATALAASVPDPTVFKFSRQFAAYLGPVPRQNSSGGKDRRGHISKMGNRHLRHTAGANCRHSNGCLGPIAHGEPVDLGCYRNHRQQDRPYRMGTAREAR